jgi:hypothetical protein
VGSFGGRDRLDYGGVSCLCLRETEEMIEVSLDGTDSELKSKRFAFIHFLASLCFLNVL